GPNARLSEMSESSRPAPRTTTTTTTTTASPEIITTTSTSTTPRPPSTESQPELAKLEMAKPKLSSRGNEETGNSVGEPPEPEDPEKLIWKLVLHGTNMNSEELRMCNRSLIEAHFKPHSRRK